MRDFTAIKSKLDSLNVATKACVPKSQRWETLYSAYQCKVYNELGEVAIFGVGSISAIRNWFYFGDGKKHNPCLVVGNYSEIHGETSILTGGEHNNNQVINVMLNHIGRYSHEITADRSGLSCSSNGPVIIGSNVVISKNVSIRSGVTIGNGSVIGLGSVVTNDIPPFAVAAGSPAKVIKYRFSDNVISSLQQTRWWDLPINKIAEKREEISKIKDGDILQFQSSDYMSKNNFIVLGFHRNNETGSTTLNIKGVEIGGRFVGYKDLEEEAAFFFSQMGTPENEPIYLIPDIFELCRNVS